MLELCLDAGRSGNFSHPFGGGGAYDPADIFRTMFSGLGGNGGGFGIFNEAAEAAIDRDVQVIWDDLVSSIIARLS